MTVRQAKLQRRNEAIRADRAKMSAAELAKKYKLAQPYIYTLLNATPEVLREASRQRKLAMAIERVKAAGYELREVG
jgi:Mor family transcriptional regulator